MSRRGLSWQSPGGEWWDAASLAGALKVAAGRRSAPHVMPLHAVLLKLGLQASAILATSLAHLALRCGLPGYARGVFDEMRHRDVVSWTSLITGHAHQGLYHDSLALLRRMVTSGVVPNGYSLSGALLSCAGVGPGALAAGEEIHARVVKMSLRGVHVFLMADQSHPELVDVLQTLDSLKEDIYWLMPT